MQAQEIRRSSLFLVCASEKNPVNEHVSEVEKHVKETEPFGYIKRKVCIQGTLLKKKPSEVVPVRSAECRVWNEK